MKKFHIRLQFRASDTSNLAVLADYLNSRDTLYSLKEMAMVAFSSFWLPLAIMDTNVPPQTKNRLIYDCVHRLKLQSRSHQAIQNNCDRDGFFSHSSTTVESSCQPKQGKPKNYSLRFQISVPEDSNEATLLNYLVYGTNLPYPFKDMAVTALENFWLPSAYNNSKDVTHADKNQVITDCTWKISLHIQYLEAMLTPVEVSSKEEDRALFSVPTVKTESPALVTPTKTAASDRVSDWDLYAER